jgi:hypothetical protein
VQGRSFAGTDRHSFTYQILQAWYLIALNSSQYKVKKYFVVEMVQQINQTLFYQLEPTCNLRLFHLVQNEGLHHHLCRLGSCQHCCRGGCGKRDASSL